MRSLVLRKVMIVLLAAGALGGCRHLQSGSSSSTSSPAPVAGKLEIRNNALSLLCDLLEDEKNLSKLLLIKRETDELDRLVKNISSFAGAGVKELKQVAKADPSLNLKALALPSGETAAREAIAKTKASALLHSSGTDFEFNLLLTQIQALSYGTHLARIAAENEPDANRARQFSDLAAEMQRLYEETVRLLRARAVPVTQDRKVKPGPATR
jgi:hypothetical protein